MIYSLLGPLVLVTCCVFKYFRFILKAEMVHSPPGAQPEVSSKEGWKKHTLFGWKHTLFGRRGGNPRALTKKIYPGLFSTSRGSLVSHGSYEFHEYGSSSQLWILKLERKAYVSFPIINDVVQLISRSDDPYPRLLIDYSMLKTAAKVTSIARPSASQEWL